MSDINSETLGELQQQNQRLSQEYADQHRILSAINSINNIVIGASSLDNMLDEILEEFLDLFDCQRAWLLYPCDPSAHVATVPKEKTRKEWPGAGAGANADDGPFELPVDHYAQEVFSAALASSAPVAFDPEKNFIDSVTHDQFGVKSMMVLAIYPKVDIPWLLGIHHCGAEHIYSELDIRLFQSLGARITDGLSSMLSLQKTQQSEALQRALLNNANAAISVKDLQGNLLLTNDCFNNLFDFTPSDTPKEHAPKSHTPTNHIHQVFSKGSGQLVEENHQRVIQTQESMEFEEQLSTSNGLRTFLSTTSPIFDNHHHIKATCTISTDITERRVAEEEIKYLAHFDYLTQLPNRLSISKKLQQAQENSDRSNHYCALLFVDLDNFKTLNDTKGHSYGDRLLKETAEILLNSIREQDTVARFGGDEFLIILPELNQHREQAIAETEAIAQRVLASLETVFVGDDFQHPMSCSIGVTLFCGHKHSPEELLKRVDAAMYQAKNSGRNTIKFFNPSLQRRLEYQVRLSSEINDAIRNNEFELYYQPQVDYRQQIVGAEALIRWNHPEKGFISPADFIPLAEENDSIIALGNWVMEQGCRQLRHWQDNPHLSSLAISVNVSAKQFHQDNFVDQVHQIISRCETPANRLKMELTESLDQQDIDGNVLKMKAIRLAGIAISLDDFGTGYSSLNCLRKLPINQLKIDQSFVRDIAVDYSSDIIIKTIIGMAHNLNIDVIAEGVETQAQRDFLIDNGCYHFQGYLFSKPLPVADFEQFVIEHQSNAVTAQQRASVATP